MKDDNRQTQLESLLQEQGEDQSGNWITIFADICLLLLTFFVLLYSMSSVDKKRFEHSFLSVRQALGQHKGGDLALRPKTRDDQGVFMREADLLRQIEEQQNEVFTDFNYFHSEHGLEGIVGARLDSGIITMEVPGDALFDSGRAELTQEGKQALRELKDFFVQHPDQKINIEGHTDNVKPRGQGRFKDNWELSSMRALNVLRYMLDLGLEPGRMTATGFADLDPVVPNTSDENRARNRRVEFVLSREVKGANNGS
ncbi:MAG: OmpA/MotB family protein [Desulfohalobiaceae bacterium]